MPPSPCARRLPDWKHEKDEFAAALTTRAAAAGTAFDGRRRRMAPLVDSTALLRVVRGGGVRGALVTAGWVLLPLCVFVMAWLVESGKDSESPRRGVLDELLGE